MFMQKLKLFFKEKKATKHFLNVLKKKNVYIFRKIFYKKKKKS